MKRWTAILAALACCALLAPVAPAEAPAEPASQAPLFLDAGACDTGVPALDPLNGAVEASCPAAFCSDDEDCQRACPSDPLAYCSGFACVFPSQGGGGGGGGGGGQSCNAFCTDDWDCELACPNLNVYCSGWACQVY